MSMAVVFCTSVLTIQKLSSLFSEHATSLENLTI
jgi:hypothetical protein